MNVFAVFITTTKFELENVIKYKTLWRSQNLSLGFRVTVNPSYYWMETDSTEILNAKETIYGGDVQENSVAAKYLLKLFET